MNKRLLWVFGLPIILLTGCSVPTNDTGAPANKPIASIATLADNETLHMSYEACHWGCVLGDVKFVGNEAHMGDAKLVLTDTEIKDLDAYFAQGRTPEEGWNCSLVISIGFERKTADGVTDKQPALHYPCDSGTPSKINPDLLLTHLYNSPEKAPYWRLTPEQQIERARRADDGTP